MRGDFSYSLIFKNDRNKKLHLRVGGDKGLPIWNRAFSRNFSLYPPSDLPIWVDHFALVTRGLNITGVRIAVTPFRRPPDPLKLPKIAI